MNTCQRCARTLDERQFASPVRCKLCQYLARYKVFYREYHSMLERQGGACAICKHVPSGVYPDILCVDHDHVWKHRIVVRGLLCPECNRGIGSFADNSLALFRAINYVERKGEHYNTAIGHTRLRRKSTPNWRQMEEEKAVLPRYEELAERFGTERFASKQWVVLRMVALVERMWDTNQEPDEAALQGIYQDLQQHLSV